MHDVERSAPAAASPSDSGAHPAVRSALLLAASVALVLNLCVVVHELGHLVADRLSGAPAALEVDPFGESSVDVAAGSSLPWWTFAAGPVANIVLGLVATAVGWRRWSPFLLPLLIWGPVALLKESTTALVQALAGEAGTDWVVLMDHGLPMIVVAAGGVVGLVAGFLGLAISMPLAGIPAVGSRWESVAPVLAGLCSYPILALLVTATFNYPASAVTRALSVLTWALIASAVTAWARQVPARPREPVAATAPAIATTLAAAAASVVALLVI